jgi:predicted GNAT superfamily acetyltransferase
MPDKSPQSSGATPIGGQFVESGPAAVEVRIPLTSIAEFDACVAVQNDVWGPGDPGHTVPSSLLLAASHVGALTIGAFDGDGEMLGFVFGLTGVKDGAVVHWSHLLAVREEARGRGIGRMLKESQRTELARRGIERIYWTFDPLQARNAHLNLNRLGVRVVEYVVDMYGASQSPLHGGLSTDRLIVMSSTAPSSSRRAPSPASSMSSIPILTPFPRPGDTSTDDAGPERGSLLIEIPPDLQDVISNVPDVAAEWRAATRANFQWALQRGYDVIQFWRDGLSGRSFYVAEKNPRPASPRHPVPPVPESHDARAK